MRTCRSAVFPPHSALRIPQWLMALCVCLSLACRSRVPVSERCCLLVTIDTCRADALSCYGSSRSQTPVLDQLARQGVLFDRCLTPVPITLPAHCSLMTGLYPPEHGVRLNGQVLSDEVPALADILRSKGVTTAGFVGAYVLARPFGIGRGFDSFDDIMNDQKRQGSPVAERTCWEVNAAVRSWMQRGLKKPSFLWVHYFDPHAPHDATLNYLNRFPDQPYFAEIATVDDALGQLIADIREKIRDRELLIVVVADHGEGLEDHGEKEHGLLLYDTTVRVPLILSGGGVQKKDRIVREPVRLIDLSATIQEWMLGEVANPGQGRSVWPLVRGRETGERVAYLESLMAYEKYGWSPMSGVCSGDWSLLMGPSPELYDVGADPQQLNDLSGQSPETLQRMMTLLRDSRDRLSPKSAKILGASGAGLKDLGYVVPSRSLGEKIPWEGGLASPARNMGVVRFETRGQAFWDEGARDAARKELMAGLEIDPDNLQLLNMMGLLLMEEENWPEALRYFERLSHVESETCRGWVNRGVCLERMGAPVEAMACYRQASQKDASNWQAWFNGARILLGQNELSEASEWARKAQALAPSDERSVAEFDRITAPSPTGSPSESESDDSHDPDGVDP